MQIILTAIIILGALGYAFWRLFTVFRDNGDPCKGCELKKSCKKFGQSK